MADTPMLEAPQMTLVERAKAIIAGTLEAPVLKLSPEGTAGLEAAFAETGVVPTERVRRENTDSLALDEHYAGQGPVACLNTGRGLVVLAVGSAQRRELMAGLSDDEAGHVEIHYPIDPFMLHS